jgi:thiol:disulfide interchange protein DsbD
MRPIPSFVALCCALVGCVGLFAGESAAAPVRSHAAEAELVSVGSAIVPGRPLDLGLRLKLDAGWHVYWKNAGDSGTPPTLAFALPEGYRAGPLQFGQPERIPTAHLVNYGYEGEVLFPVRVEVPADAGAGNVTIRAKADWLECKESCLPATAALAITLPVGPAAGTSRWATLFDATRARMPVALPATVRADSGTKDGLVGLALLGLDGCRNADFFPDREGLFVHAKIVRVPDAGGALRFTLPLETNAAPPERLTGIVTCAPGSATARAFEVAATVVAGPGPGAPVVWSAPAGGADLSLAVALVFAFLGGVVLNLMPCVFPILGLKILAIAQHAGRADRRYRTMHALQFLAGVLASFGVLAGVMLALRAAGEQVGWGFQLQSPIFVSAMAVLFFVLALNLSGAFEWGGRLQSAAGRVGSRFGGAFFDGVLAVLVASPCTAPLMGAAIGFTLAQPAPVVLAVFAALALGMALPYVVLTLAPRLTRRLPKPGPWLESVRQFMAFPLYATVLWLAWVLGELTSLGATIRLGVLLLAIAVGLWLLRRRAARVLAVLLAAALFAGATNWWHDGISAPAPAAAVQAQGDWRTWSPTAFAEARATGKPVFVDFTAAWCVTCQVNKQAVLGTAPVARALQDTGTIAMRADWTRRDPAITTALAALGRNGVPVYALYAPDGRVTLLPEVLTTSMVVEALNQPATPARVAGESR